MSSPPPQAFEQHPAAKYQDWQLYERHHEKKDYLQLPQSLLTFLLRHLHEEILRPPQPTSAIYLTFGSKVSVTWCDVLSRGMTSCHGVLCVSAVEDRPNFLSVSQRIENFERDCYGIFWIGFKKVHPCTLHFLKMKTCIYIYAGFLKEIICPIPDRAKMITWLKKLCHCFLAYWLFCPVAISSRCSIPFNWFEYKA